MIDPEESQPGFNIGVGSPDGAVPTVDTAVERAQSRRSLPVWGLVVFALLVGWLLGSLLGARSSESGESAASESVELPSGAHDEPADDLDLVAPDDGDVDSSAMPALQTAPPQTTPGQTDPKQTIPLPGVALVLAQLSGSDRLPSAVTSIDDIGSSTVRVEQRIVGPTQAVGDVGQRVQLVDQSVVFVAGRQAVVIDAGATEPPQIITDAATLLAGSGSGDLWALTDGSRTLRLVDVASRSVRATYDLSVVGAPLASYNGGLVVDPDVERFGPFALWSPARGIERLWSLDEEAAFVDAADNVIVVHTAQGLATYNAVTGALTQTERQLTDVELAGAFVSATGARLAIVQPLGDGPIARVEVLDLATGNTVDEFKAGAPWLIHWSSNDELIYFSPNGDNQVRLRNTAFRFDTALVTIGTEVTWMILAE